MPLPELPYNDVVMRGKRFKTFREVKEEYEVEKWWHAPWHFSQSGHYTCFLKGGLECYKDGNDYVVGKRR